MKIRTRGSRLEETAKQAKVVELPPRSGGWGKRFLQLDKLVRDFAVVGCLMLVVIAVRNAQGPQAQSVFGALKESAGMQWDESLGKLSFVNQLLPEAVREVWNESPVAIAVSSPADGEVVHSWSVQEPYLFISSKDGMVKAAAAGEVMSVAHGLNEERILRLRHDDRTETIYGNLKEVLVEVGDYVAMGEPVGTVLEVKSLAFELRVDGRSVAPSEDGYHQP